MSVENPYQPPASGPVPELQTRDCPDCGSVMKPGEASGSLYWSEEGRSPLRRFLTPGKPLNRVKSFRITLTGPSLEGHHCENCGLTMLKALRSL